MFFSLPDYAKIFQALSDETRLQICQLLSGKEVCACQLLEQLSITQPTLSYHMKHLCSSGLVNGRKDGTWMRYTLNQERIALVQEFLESIKEQL